MRLSFSAAKQIEWHTHGLIHEISSEGEFVKTNSKSGKALFFVVNDVIYTINANARQKREGTNQHHTCAESISAGFSKRLFFQGACEQQSKMSKRTKGRVF